MLSDFGLQTDNNGTFMLLLSGLWNWVGWWLVPSSRSNVGRNTNSHGVIIIIWINHNNYNNTTEIRAFLKSSRLIHWLFLRRFMQKNCEIWLLALSRPSVRPPRVTCLPLDGFSYHFLLEIFLIFGWENSNILEPEKIMNLHEWLCIRLHR
jgi:hypothetical protein